MRRVGAHLSIAGGMDKAVRSIVDKGGNCLQIFSSSPRMWLEPKTDGSLAQAEAKKFKTLCQEHDIKPVFIHAKYLINLGSNKPELVKISVKSLIHDMKMAEMIKAQGVIVHLGSHLGQGWGMIEKQVISSIKQVLSSSQGKAELIVENSAGQKGKIGSQISEIGLILATVGSDRLTWCLDTCHAWSAGYSLGKGSDKLIKEMIQFDILDKLSCLHVNDSRDEFGSGKDRHANLGQGKMGKKELKLWVNHPKLRHLPLIIETPGFEGQGPDKKNLDILKSYLDEK